MADDPLTDRFPEMQPGRKPALGNIYGIGTTLIGRRDYDVETGSYVRTHSVTVFFIPLFAIGAYRVVDAPGGGWYCLGKVPLSGFARIGSVAMVLVLLAVGGGVWWKHHTGTPEYAARQKLKEADRAAAAGQGGQAARLYREVMDSKTDHADEGKHKLGELIENPPGQPAEAAAIYAVAVDLHRENRCPTANLFETGKTVASRFADTDPAAALDLLEVIAPFATDTAAELAVRCDLLEKLHARDPNDLDAISRLAAACEAKGDGARCEKLLTPHEARLGSRDGAAILGRILASKGQNDRAYALLKPFVDAHLPAYRAAEENYTAQAKTSEQRAVDLLRTGKASGFNFDLYDRAPKQRQQAMLDEFIGLQLKTDPALRDARKRLMTERAAIPAALELGLVQLQRGEALADPAARKAELEAAEKTFLSIRGFAGESDEYRLSLGRVYYWLGRPAEGKNLFDELLKSNGHSTQMVLLVASTLRNLGDTSEARRMIEEAYGKETDATKKHHIADFRALLRIDIDDEIVWLSRSNTDEPHVKASLAYARGNKAAQDGKDDEAATQFRQSIEIYDKMQEITATLNNSALVHLALYRITQDPAEFTRGADKLDRAIALEPSDSILLFNAATTVTDGAFVEAAGNSINFRILKRSPGWDELPYLYRGAAERIKVSDRAAKHPGMVKARAYAEKLMILAPKRPGSYRTPASIFGLARDLEGLKGVLARLQKAELDLGDATREYQEFLSGQSDARHGPQARKSLDRAKEGLASARARKDRTFAVAVGNWLSAEALAWSYGDNPDVNELVKLAEEAHAAAPSDGTASTLAGAILFRAHLSLIGANADYAKLAKSTKRSLGTYLIYYALATDSPLRAAVAANADVKRATALRIEDFHLDADEATPMTWLMARAVVPAEAAAIAAGVKGNERLRVRRKIDRALTPPSAAQALEDYAILSIEGKDDEAKRALGELEKLIASR